MNSTNILLIIAIGLLLYIVLNKNDATHSETIYHYDTTQKQITVNVKPPDVSVTMPAQQLAALKIDTADIIASYFTKNFYQDTIKDSNIVAIVSDTIFNNNIISRNFKYTWQQPTTIIKKEKGLQIYGGLGITTDARGVGQMYLNGSIARSRNIYTIGYSTARNIYLGYSIKLSK